MLSYAQDVDGADESDWGAPTLADEVNDTGDPSSARGDGSSGLSDPSFNLLWGAPYSGAAWPAIDAGAMSANSFGAGSSPDVLDGDPSSPLQPNATAYADDCRPLSDPSDFRRPSNLPPGFKPYDDGNGRTNVLMVGPDGKLYKTPDYAKKHTDIDWLEAATKSGAQIAGALRSTLAGFVAGAAKGGDPKSAAILGRVAGPLAAAGLGAQTVQELHDIDKRCHVKGGW